MSIPRTLPERAHRSLELLADCTICPRQCRVNRRQGEVGICGIGREALVASYGPHFGEERPLVARGGSGTIFFSGCNLLCSFCQNCDISHGRVGRRTDAERLAWIMRYLRRSGCENINLVTPTHVVPQILEALAMADDVTLPIVYNTHSYDSLETLRLLDGVVDIYLADFKFWKGGGSSYLSGVDDYGDVAAEALCEMHRQVGDLKVRGGRAVRGLMVRHLVMPGGVSDTERIMEFIAGLSKDTYVNIMPQYTPHYHAVHDPAIGRRISHREFAAAVDAARRAGLRRIET
ncbi:MAG: 4Fe-4S cluster-binding domain-containing protein [Spirochaetaceae bacterium]